MRLQDYYQQSCTGSGACSTPSGGHPGASPASQSNPSTMTDEVKVCLRQWHYCVQLAKHLYEVCMIIKMFY